MFEKIMYNVYCQIMEDHLDSLDKAENNGDFKKADLYSKKALRIGRRILSLEKKVGVDPEGSVKNIFDIIQQGYTSLNN